MGEKVVASACLCGVICRWHGRKAPKPKAIKELEAAGIEVIPVCPEMLGGLTCPRPPVKTRKGRVYETDPETRTTFGTELTETFRAGAQKALEIALAAGVRQAYLCKNSPSCALSGIAGKVFIEAGIEVISLW
ncbi:MAG: DUF523 domain-containing protein [Syntrophobacteraceae bacterium]